MSTFPSTTGFELGFDPQFLIAGLRGIIATARSYRGGRWRQLRNSCCLRAPYPVASRALYIDST